MGRIDKIEQTAKEIVNILADKKYTVEEASYVLRRAQSIIGEQTKVSRTECLREETNNTETKKEPQDISGIKERNNDKKLDFNVEMKLSTDSVAEAVNLISKKIEYGNVKA